MRSTRVLSLALLVFLLAHAPLATALTEEEKNSIDLYRHLAPGVVSISSTVVGHGLFLNAIPRQGTGSGSIIDSRGYILTNYHVIGSGKIEVGLSDGTSHTARLVGFDPDTDLAVIKIEAPKETLTAIPMGDSADLKVGQKAIAIGNPFGLGLTLTVGVVSSVGRTMRAENGALLEDIIQTDASINPGNSGGPLIDSSGKMIGITTAIFSPTGASIGIGFAIPVNTAKRISSELIKKGYYSHPFLGVTLMDLFPDISHMLGLPVKSGAIVVETVPGGPADKAGIKGGNRKVQIGNNILTVGGDVIVSLNGLPVRDADTAIRAIHKLQPGDKLRVGIVRRDGTSKTITVTLGEKPRGASTRQP